MVDKATIHKAFEEGGTDKHIVHGYDRWYSEIFKDYIPDSLMEIGVLQGQSLVAWRSLFPNVKLTGIDITDKRFKKNYINYSDAKIVIGNSTNPEEMKSIKTSHDVIIDDGSHFYKHIIKTFNVFKDRFNYAYIIEDAMYKQDFTVKCIRKLGFNNIKIYPSLRKNIPVNEHWLRTGSYGGKKMFNVSLNLIVVYRD